jgi:hypothetical protein
MGPGVQVKNLEVSFDRNESKLEPRTSLLVLFRQFYL